MTQKSEQLVDLIFNKLKTYKNKKIFLDKENLDKFIKIYAQRRFGRSKILYCTLLN